MVDQACKGHALNAQDVAHLKLYGKGVISEAILDKMAAPDVKDVESMEKLALANDGMKVDEGAAVSALMEIDKDSNLLEVIEGMLKEKGVKYEKNKVVCGGRVRAAFELTEEKVIIDVVDQQYAHYVDRDGVKKLKTKGRKAEEIAKEHGYKAYKLVSLVEMDFAKDEQAFINEVLFGKAATR